MTNAPKHVHNFEIHNPLFKSFGKFAVEKAEEFDFVDLKIRITSQMDLEFNKIMLLFSGK